MAAHHHVLVLLCEGEGEREGEKREGGMEGEKRGRGAREGGSSV